MREILFQAPDELNSSVDEWVTSGEFFLMSHILLLLIQRCVYFESSGVAPFIDIYLLYKGHEFNRSLYKVSHECCSVIFDAEIPSRVVFL